MSDRILGIDLGTTNSEVAIIQDRKPILLAENGDPILPSVVGLGADGKLLVGHAAKNQYVVAPERTVRSIKRKMGQDVTVSLGDQNCRPQEISAMILRALRDRATRQLGQAVSKAVITVPAYFNDGQRQATREAGELAGLEVVRILNEPTAAALAYDPDSRELRRVLVYDLGGGTFDVSVVAAEDGVVEVLASHGDTHLGGDDFDELLMTLVCDRFAEEHGIDLRKNLMARARLLRAVEAAKCRLSDHPFARLEEEFISEKNGVALHFNLEISRTEYENLIRPSVERTMDCVQRALDDAALTGRAIDQVVLVGGSTRTPLIGQLLEDRLGKPAHRELNPELVVAMGAAIQGAIIAGDDVGAVLVDVTPHTLGIKCMDEVGQSFGLPFLHRFVPIIGRNTPLPASRSELFRTVDDQQDAVEIEVYQGEESDVRQNHRVGRFMVQGLAPVEAGNQIVVQLDLNLDGMLTVSAREKATGLQKRITIDNALAHFEHEEFEGARERLDELWQAAYPDEGPADSLDQVESDTAMEPTVPELAPGPREGQRESVQAKALLEKAGRLGQNASPEDRLELERLMERVRVTLTDRHWSMLANAANELADALFYLEDA